MTSEIRVLIVDDSKDVRRSLQELLSMTVPVEVVGEAENGRRAVELVKRLRPDVVLMGREMPVMDGLEATGRIRSAGIEVPDLVKKQ